jgi:hypothetical protein
MTSLNFAICNETLSRPVETEEALNLYGVSPPETKPVESNSPIRELIIDDDFG